MATNGSWHSTHTRQRSCQYVPITHNKNCSSIGSEQLVQIVDPTVFDDVDGGSCILKENFAIKSREDFLIFSFDKFLFLTRLSNDKDAHILEKTATDGLIFSLDLLFVFSCCHFSYRDKICPREILTFSVT